MVKGNYAERYTSLNSFVRGFRLVVMLVVIWNFQEWLGIISLTLSVVAKGFFGNFSQLEMSYFMNNAHAQIPFAKYTVVLRFLGQTMAIHRILEEVRGPSLFFLTFSTSSRILRRLIAVLHNFLVFSVTTHVITRLLFHEIFVLVRINISFNVNCISDNQAGNSKSHRLSP